MKILIVGSGISGATCARILAESNNKITIIEKNAYIGGSCFDYLSEDLSCYIHKFGPHIFHTNNETVWKFITRFSTFNNYVHCVYTKVNNNIFTFPINLNVISKLYNKNVYSKEDVDNIIHDKYFENPKNFEEAAINSVGTKIYEHFIKNYTEKQWNCSAKDLPIEIFNRINIRYNFTNDYFPNQYQGQPIEGYTNLIKNMLNHKNITLILKPESSSIELLGGFKIAAMFATSEKGSINNSSVKGFKVSLNMAVAGYTYIASLIAYNGGNYVTATTVAYVESEFELNSTLKEPSKLTSVGGLVAYMASQSVYSSSVENVTVTVNISGVKALYNGGLIGHARAVNVISCKVYGEMNISLNGGEQTYIGGILGRSYNSNITTTTIGAVLNIATSDLAGQQFIGALVGNAEASTDTTCSITNCYAPYGRSYKGNTYMSGGTLVLGVYGSMTGNVSIPNDVLTYKN